ncbi:MAG: response regulator [Mediterranea sp.]|jgi:signal transduction histidine kinase/ligand-binding sensor domain-containing protein/DNA-binding response OmpR family regulator|nr:response regulator [Mediterranea sp.]
MKETKYRLVTIAIILLLPLAVAHAGPILFKRIDTGAGLSYSLVNAIAKDSEGFVWFCTASGLNRYDGYRFKVYRHVPGDTTSLPNNYVLGMVEAADGQCWVKTNAGYALLDLATERFARDPRPFMRRMGSRGTPAEVLADSLRQTLWLYVAGEGCYRYDHASQRHVLLPIGDGGLPAHNLSGMAEAGRYLLLTYEDGAVACVGKETMSLEWINRDIAGWTGLRTQEVFSCYIDREGCAWIYGVPGLWVYDLGKRQWRDDLKGVASFVPQDFVHAITQDADGRIWMGLDQGGIKVVDKRALTTTTLTADEHDERSLPHNTVYSLYADPGGLVWVGTYKKGLAYYGKSIYKFGFDGYGDITCVEEDMPGGDLWLGTNDRGLLRVDPERKAAKTYSTENGQLPSNIVVSLLKTRGGELWVGMFHGGLLRIDADGRSTSFRMAEGGLANDNVWALAEDGDANIWIGTLGGGLQCYDTRARTFTTYTTANSGLPDNYIASIGVGSDHTLLVGTASNGIALMDLRDRKLTQSFTEHSTGEALVNDYINQVYEDSRQLVWIGTREGVSVYDRRHRRMAPHPVGAGMNDPVSAITEDKEGNVWISSSRELLRVEVERKDDIPRFKTRTYGVKDGLQRGDLNLRSIKTLRSGTIVVGGLYGINLFNPSTMRYNSELPRVMFTSLSLFGEEVKVGQAYQGRILLPRTLNRATEVKLGYKQNIVGVTFASDNFELPEEAGYVYRLDGVNDNWLTLPAGTHGVTFTNLSPGHYRLRVKAINSDGYPGTHEATLRLTVLPPPWRSIWAYIAYALLAAALLAAARRHILRRERGKYELRRMEEEAAKREELNQMKFRFFTNISHELRTPLTLIISPLEALVKEERDDTRKNTLELMRRNAQRLLYLVNQLLDFRKGEMSNHRLSPAEGDIIGFTRATCDAFLALAEKRGIHFSFLAGEERFTMAFDADKIGKVVVNLLSNAFKYTPQGGRVSVSVEHVGGEGEALEMKVADNGIGIGDSDKPYVFDRFYRANRKGMEETTGTGIGLSLVHDFVELHGGSVELFDNFGGGSVFVVRLPVTHVESQPGAETHDDLAEEPAEAVESPASSRPRREKGRPLVLVVDDNEDFRLFMKQNLELYYRVETAASGQQAWEMMNRGDELPDLVLCDVMMPEMDGNELTRLIKGNRRTACVPVILLTARQAAESKLEGLRTGADDYLTKPFSMDILQLRVDKLIEWRRNREEITPTIDPSPDPVAVTSMDEKLIQRAIRYVEENLQDPDLSVARMSRDLGMSRIRLYKKLLQITGRTPIEFIRLIRLKRAAQLLRESQMFVSEIAYEVGFSNPKYFSRYFREEFGELPTAYQRRAKEEGGA